MPGSLGKGWNKAAEKKTDRRWISGLDAASCSVGHPERPPLLGYLCFTWQQNRADVGNAGQCLMASKGEMKGWEMWAVELCSQGWNQIGDSRLILMTRDL